MRKRLFFDIETAPNVGWFWECGYNINLTTRNILKERAIICIGYQWEDEKTTHCLAWDPVIDPRQPFNDKAMLEAFAPILEQADEIVGHNLKKFDERWVRTQSAKYGIELRPNLPLVDTLEWARGRFNFNSNKLDDLAAFFDIPCRKIKTDISWWTDVFWMGYEKALRRMMRYCKQDVRVLMQVHAKMEPYVPNETSLSDDLRQCPYCGAFAMQSRGTHYTRAGMKRQELRCRECRKSRTVPAIKYGRHLERV